MKKYIINCFLLATVFVVGCKKNDARYPFTVALARVPYVNLSIDPTGSASIDVLNLANFSGKYNTSLLYPSDVPPAKVDLVIIKNGVNSSVKLLQAGITTFPSSTFTITAAQIQTLFGAPIVLGDNYDIGADIYTQDGTKYEAFPIAGSTNLLSYSGTGQANQPGFVPTIRFGAICAYDPLIYQGNFVVVSDAFQDVNPGTVIQLVKISNNSFSVTYPDVSIFPFPPPPIVVVVNTANNTITVAKQKIGTKIYNAYDNINVQATGGSVSPCAQTATLNFNFTVDQGSFGTTPYVIKKQ
jgi:hypothetical protein